MSLFVRRAATAAEKRGYTGKHTSMSRFTFMLQPNMRPSAPWPLSHNGRDCMFPRRSVAQRPCCRQS